MSSSPNSSSSKAAEVPANRAPSNRAPFRDVPVMIEVLLGKGGMPVRQLLRLEPGAVLRLDSAAGADLRRPRHRRADGARRSRDHRGLGGRARHPRPHAERRGRLVSPVPGARGRSRGADRRRAVAQPAGDRRGVRRARRARLGGAPRPPRLLHPPAVARARRGDGAARRAALADGRGDRRPPPAARPDADAGQPRDRTDAAVAGAASGGFDAALARAEATAPTTASPS